MTTLDKSRNLWLLEGNFKETERVEGVPARPYPLAFRCPPTALSTEGESIKLEPFARTISCCCELAVVVDRSAHRIDEATAADHIRGYRVMISLRDSSHLDRLALPTARDKGVCEYYGRWNDGFNCLSQVFLPHSEAGDLYNRAVRLDITDIGQVTANTTSLVLRAPGVLSFLSQFLTLQSGDIIALGPTHPILVIPADQPLPKDAMVRGEIEGLAAVATPIIDWREQV